MNTLHQAHRETIAKADRMIKAARKEGYVNGLFIGMCAGVTGALFCFFMFFRLGA